MVAGIVRPGGILVSDMGSYLGTLSLSALPPYANGLYPGTKLATISGKTAGSVLTLEDARALGYYALSPDGTALLAGPNYSSGQHGFTLREAAWGYANNPTRLAVTALGVVSGGGGSTGATGAVRNVAIGSALPNQVVSLAGTQTRFKERVAYVIAADTDTLFVPWANTYISNTTPNEIAGPSDINVEKVAIEYNGRSMPITYGGGNRSATITASINSQVNSDGNNVSGLGLTKILKGTTVYLRYLGNGSTAGGVAATAFGTEQQYRFPPGTPADDDIDGTGVLSTPSGALAVNVPGPVGIFGRVYGTPVSLVVSGDSIADNTNDFPGAGGDGSSVTSLTGGGGWISRMCFLAQIPLLKMTLGGHKAANYGNPGGGAVGTWRNSWWQFGTHGLNELIINDTASTVNIQVYCRNIHTYMWQNGIQRVMQATATPKTLNDSAATPWNVNTVLANETATNPPDFLTINANLRADVGGAYHLNEIIDIENTLGDASNRRLYPIPPSQLSTTLAAATTATSTSSISLNAPAAFGKLLAIGAGATGVQVVKVNGPSTGAGPYATPIVTQTLAAGAASGTAVVETWSADGTHPGPLPHAFVAGQVKTQAQGWTASG